MGSAVSLNGCCDAQRRAGLIAAAALRDAGLGTRIGLTVGAVALAAGRSVVRLGGELVFRDAGGSEDVALLVNGVQAAGNSTRHLRDGDLVSLDVGCRWGGWCADAARTWRVSADGKSEDPLLSATRKALRLGIESVARSGGHWAAAAEEVRSFVESFGEDLRAELTGHGIGRELHEDPVVVGEAGWVAAASGGGFAVELSVWRESAGGRSRNQRPERFQFEETIWFGAGGVEILTAV